jgi:HEPN domain-containing protein
MKRATAEWIERAEGDWKVAQREMQAADPVWNVVCFLAQQCAEKYLKAFLEEQGIPFEKTHDLMVLLDLTGGQLPDLEAMRPQLAYLSPFAITARYPGVQTNQQTAEVTSQIAGQMRTVVRAKLGLA